MGLHPAPLSCPPTCAGGGGGFQRLQEALQRDVGQQLPQGVPAPAVGRGHGGGSSVVSTRQGTSVWWPVHIWKATSVSSTRVGISPEQGQAQGPERSLQGPCLCPQQDLAPQKQSQQQETPLLPSPVGFLTVSQKLAAAGGRPARQAGSLCAGGQLDVVPAVPGGENKAGDHKQTRTASPLAGSRGFISQPPPPGDIPALARARREHPNTHPFLPEHRGSIQRPSSQQSRGVPGAGAVSSWHTGGCFKHRHQNKVAFWAEKPACGYKPSESPHCQGCAGWDQLQSCAAIPSARTRLLL